MQMKEVCEKFDLTPDTIRYYEKIGLIGEVPRDKNGYRVFLEKNLNEIYFSKVMRGAGILVKELVEYVKLVQIGEETIKEREKEQAQWHHTWRKWRTTYFRGQQEGPPDTPSEGVEIPSLR